MVKPKRVLNILIKSEFDPEGAKHELLAQLQKVDQAFAEDRLFPQLAQLARGLQGLWAVKEDRNSTKEGLQNMQDMVEVSRQEGIQRKEVSDRPFEHKDADYDRDLPQLSRKQKIESVFWLTDFAIENMSSLIKYGKEVYESVSDSMEIATVGVVPSYQLEGYMLIPNSQTNELVIQRYTFGRVEQMSYLQSMVKEGDGEITLELKTSQIKTITYSPTMPTLATIKSELIEQRRDLPKPATFHFKVDKSAPFEDTILPIAKRELMRHLAK